jgi:hypothetical protein
MSENNGRYYIKETIKTPRVSFDRSSGELSLTGRSIPENATKFYEPLVHWAEEYKKSPSLTTNLRLNLEYFNSSSTLWIARLIKTLSGIREKNSLFFIHVYFLEEDFENFSQDEIKDIIGSLVNNLPDPMVSIGIKVHCLDENGRIISGSTVLFSRDNKYTVIPLTL